MPKRTITIIDKLAELGLPDRVFRSLHHLGTPMLEHRDYCTTVSAFRANKAGERTNDLVRDRLEYIDEEIKQRRLTTPIPVEVWQDLAAEAKSRCRLATQRQAQGIHQPEPIPQPATEADDQPDATGQLDDDLLGAFVSGFFGYGSPNARFWFIGMEEGGGDHFREVERRLSCWDQRGRRQLEDLRDFHEAFGEHRWFEQRRLQPTWSLLIRAYLSARFQSTDEDAVRDFQTEQLARQGGDTSLLELFPLPSPSTSAWRYGSWSTLPALVSRQRYMEKLVGPRLDGLARLLTEHRPRAVVFYGTTYRDLWNRLIPTSGRRQHFDVAGSTIDVTEDAGTGYAICAHPSKRGITSGYFITLGRKLRPFLKEPA